MMAKFKRGQLVIYKDEPDLYSIRTVLEFPNSPGALYCIRKIGSDEDSKIANERNLTAVKATINEEDKTMATTTNKNCDYTVTPEELELEKAVEAATEEAEKKIRDIRIELSKKLEALRTEYQEKEAIKREERQAHAWKRRYDALLKEGFSIEQAWEMMMEAFKAD